MMSCSCADAASLPTAFLVLFWPAFCLVLLCMCLATMRGAADAKLELLMTQMLMTQDKLERRMTQMLDASSALPKPSNHMLENLIIQLIESVEKCAPILNKSASREVGCQTKVRRLAVGSVPKTCSGISQPQDISRVPSSSGESVCRVSSSDTLKSQPEPVWTCSIPQLSDANFFQHACGAANKGTSLHTSSLHSISRRPRPVIVDEALTMLFSGPFCKHMLMYVRLLRCMYM